MILHCLTRFFQVLIMAKTKFEDVIAEKGKLIYTNVGDSMYPLIQPRDLLVIQKVTRRLQKFDVPLYKRDTGQYVLHRIMKIERDGSYVMCGDNRCYPEHGISDRHIIGVLTDIIRDGRTIPVGKPKPFLWFHSITYRKVLHRLGKK